MSVVVVKAFQIQNDLEQDGIAGRNTLAAARAVIDESRLLPDAVPGSVDLRDDGVLGSDYQRLVWAWANWFADAGACEIGGNNSGPWVAFFHQIPDDGNPDNDGSWCASFAATCHELAAAQLGIEVPANYSRRARGGAKAFTNRIAAGGTLVAPVDVRDGRLYQICWDRGSYAWQGHIEYGYYDAARDDFVTIGANVGNYRRVAGRVRRFRHENWTDRLWKLALPGA